jgi:hypothetical protein
VVSRGGVALKNLITDQGNKMLNAYGSNFRKFIYKSQLLLSLGVWFLIEGIFDHLLVKSALSFYIYDELNILDGKAAISPEPPYYK